MEIDEGEDDRVIVLKDLKTFPNPVYNYTSKDHKVPLVIDNGSFQSRVGFSSHKKPQLIFRNLVAKPRKDRNKKETKEEVQNVQPVTQIGNDIVNIEAMRFQLRTQFDKNVVTHYYLQEQIFDYIFTNMGINTTGAVNHPIVMTEPTVNPNYCRSLMSELLFECYNVPSVCYGIDSLFSFSFNEKSNGTGLIVSIGYTTTHVIPYIDGQHIADKIRRINLGGYHMISYMHRLLQLKYPVHVNNITLSRGEELIHGHVHIAYDYKETLQKWASHEFYENNIKKIQLPFSQVVAPPTLTAEQKTEKRKEMSRRLAEINARKREEKLAEDEEQLQRLEEILENYDDDEDEEELEMGLKEFELKTYEELEKLISVTKARIEKIKLKMISVESGVVVEEKPIAIPQPPADKTIEEWVVEIREKKNRILEKKQTRKQRRSDLAKRRTAAAQERMRIISKLAGKEKGTDDFGSRDEDWDVYKAISRDQDSDSEAENEKLLEFDDILRHHDPLLNENDEPQLKMGMAEYHQLHYGVEAFRAVEVLFQPSMIGIGEAGLAETIDYVLKLFPSADQQRLVDNVFLTGGVTKIPGLVERLNKELMEIRPFQSTFSVKMAKDPSLDAWNGARKFATSGNLDKHQITRADYDEKGGEYINEYFASNSFFPTPIGEKFELIQ